MRILIQKLSFVLLFLLLSCSHSNPNPYKLALPDEGLSHHDPLDLVTYIDVTFFSQICGRITKIDESSNIIGDLAASWEISDDGKTFTFQLKKDRHFSDGSPLTSHDVEYTFHRILESQDFSHLLKYGIDGVKVIDDHSFQLIAKKSNSRMLSMLTNPRFCVLDDKNPFLEVDGYRFPNSPGTYHVTQIQKNEILLEVNGDFSDLVREKKVLIQFLSIEKAIDKFNQGQLHDLSFFLLTEEDLKQIKMDYKTKQKKMYWTWMVSLNPMKGPFQKLENRHRFIHQFDQKKFLATWKAHVMLGYSLIPHGMTGHSDKDLRYKNKKKGSILCDKPLVVSLIQGMPNVDRLGQAIKEHVQSVGQCEVLIQVLKMADFSKNKARLESDIYVSGLVPNNHDPLNFFRFYVFGSDSLFHNYDNEAFNKRFHELFNQDYKLRKQDDIDRLHEAFYQLGYGVPIGYPVFQFVYSADVVQADINPLGMNFNQWSMTGR
jgi:peptide/nickel transport system substrate-binding protein